MDNRKHVAEWTQVAADQGDRATIGGDYHKGGTLCRSLTLLAQSGGVYYLSLCRFVRWPDGAQTFRLFEDVKTFRLPILGRSNAANHKRMLAALGLADRHSTAVATMLRADSWEEAQDSVERMRALAVGALTGGRDHNAVALAAQALRGR